MTYLSLLLLAGTVSQPADASAVRHLDPLMRDVTEACLLPDLRAIDPRPYLTSHGWRATGNRWEKRIADATVVVEVRWPASGEQAAACSFSTADVSVTDTYAWLRQRMGEPNDLPWDDRKVAGWRINTNGHPAGIYVSRNDPDGERPGLLLHILQN